MPTPPIPSTRTGYVLQWRWSDDHPWGDYSGLCATYGEADAQKDSTTGRQYRTVKREITDTLLEEQ